MYEKNNGINRRVFFVGGGMVLLSSLLLSRLWNLQIEQKDKFILLSDKNRVRLTPVFPERGNFLDRNGKELAINSSNFKLSFVPGDLLSEKQLIEKISSHINLDFIQLKKIEKSLKKNNLESVDIKDNLTIDEIYSINNLTEDKDLFLIENDFKRSYLAPESFAHLIGYTGESNKGEINTKGLTGLEKKYDDILSGHLGYIKTEVNSLEKNVRVLDKRQAIDGQDIILTIDKDLQNKVYSIMGKNSGAASVMNVKNGEILALCSTPSFDNNKFISGFTVEEWENLSRNEMNPFVNKVVNGEYPPGSTFKIVTALAGLEDGTLDIKKTVFCEGKTTYGNRDFHCWRDKGHKEVNLTKAVKESCDVYFYDLAKKLGIEKITNMAFRLGLGRNFNLINEAERKGLLPTADWRRDKLKNRWNLGDTLVAGIGQGYIAATPLQLNVMISMIANKGFYIEPNIVRSPKIKKEKNLVRPAGFDFTNVDIIRELLDIAVNEKGGNAYQSRIIDKDWKMAGKTGTSQVKEITKEEREETVVIAKKRKDRDHALFVGYAPTKKPKYAVSVIIEHGGSGSQKAAPIGRDILLACKKVKTSGYRV